MYPQPKINARLLKDGHKIQVARFHFNYYPNQKSETLDFFSLSMRRTKYSIKFDSINKKQSFGISTINKFYLWSDKYDKSSSNDFSIYFVCLTKHLKQYLDKADEIMKGYGIKLLDEYL